VKRVLCVLGLALAACSRSEPAGAGGGAALLRNLLRARAIEIVAEKGPVGDACGKAAERIGNCRVLAPGEIGDARAARIVLSAPGTRTGASLLARLGVQVGARAGRPYFVFQRAVYGGASDLLAAVLEDPERPGLPLTFVFANDPQALAHCAANLEPGWKPWFRIYRAGALSREGPVDANGAIVELSAVDREKQRAREMAGYVDLPSGAESLRVLSAKDVDAALRDAYLEDVARARAATARWAGTAGSPRTLELILHARPETFAVCSGGGGLSSWNPGKNVVHVLLSRGIPHDAGLAAARACAEDVLGAPAEAWLADGAAVSGTGSWWGRDLEEWIGWLRAGRLSPSVAALVDARAAEANSIHAILPLRAALFRYLLETRGEARVRELWKGTAALAVDTELEKSFAAWLDEIAARRRASFEARRSARREALLAGPFLAGVGIEEPDRSPRRGFGSAEYEQCLLEAAAIGANTAVLHCFVLDEREPIAVPDLAERPPGGARVLGPLEGDVRVFAGLCQARQRGMRTILAPHLLTSPAGSLAGIGPQGEEAGWQKLFDGYTRYAVHVGLLAELADADGLFLGGGTVESTNVGPSERDSSGKISGWKLEGWPKVIRAARGAFSGTISWTAASMVEASTLPFWDDLDAVACDLEPELDGGRMGPDVDPHAAIGVQIATQLAGLESLAREHGKPCLLSQAGFRSGETGLQELQYEALGDEVRAAREKGALRGVVLWRWSSDPADLGVNGRDRLLRRGPAREAAARAFAGG
jgi:hypothetical protein